MNTLGTKQSWAFIADWLQAGSINIFGLPLAGKDTQAERLAHHLNGTVLSGGQILRDSYASLPKHVNEAMARGILPSIEEYIKTVTPYLSKLEFAGKPLILSSVGRWHGEEPGIIEAAEKSGHPLKVVVFLNLDETTRHQRWTMLQRNDDRGRADDSAEVQATRKSEFENKTLPVIQFYRDRGILLEVDAAGTRDEVEAHIHDALVDFARAN